MDSEYLLNKWGSQKMATPAYAKNMANRGLVSVPVISPDSASIICRYSGK
jgi:hypothetical protein